MKQFNRLILTSVVKQLMGPSVYIVLGWWAHPSTLYSVGGPIHLHGTRLVGPSIYLVLGWWAHPSTWHLVGGPIRLHGTRLVGPSIYMALGWWAHPSALYSVGGPIHLYCTRFIGPSVFIAHHSLHLLVIIDTFLYYPLYYIPLAHPFLSGTHYTSAHSYIMVQLPPWAEVGWPVFIGTLSTLAGRLRQVCVTVLCGWL